MSDRLSFEDLVHEVEGLYRADEESCVDRILPDGQMDKTATDRACARATRWVEYIRQNHRPANGAEDIFSRFGLESDEGKTLVFLVESLLRIPDQATVDALIRDKLSDAHWDKVLASDLPLPLGIKGRALSLTSKLVGFYEPQERGSSGVIAKLAEHIGRPLVREAIKTMIGWVADQFILGSSPETAFQNALPSALSGSHHNFTSLAEGARTAEDAKSSLQAYLDAMSAAGAWQKKNNLHGNGFSIKLSALHPRFETAQAARVRSEILPPLVTLCRKAASNGLSFTIDAEDSGKLFLTLDIASDLLEAIRDLDEWDGLGFTVQAYQKCARAVIDAYYELARKNHRHLRLRLVKGVYWDTEVRRAQENGLGDFPVYTRKASTDLSYLAAARQIQAYDEWLRPVFATHNALTVASLIETSSNPSRLSFERLQGMGEDLFELMQQEGFSCGIYAPFGDPASLLGYLVRRLLESGAATSFVNRLYDPNFPIDELLADPASEVAEATQKRHPLIRLPRDIFAPERKNSMGLDLSDPHVLESLYEEMEAFSRKDYSAVPIIGGKKFGPADHVRSIKNPANGSVLGEVLDATPSHMDSAFAAAEEGFEDWSEESVGRRASCIEKFADLLEENRFELISLLSREAGKTLPEAVAEVREAVNDCRYYALSARESLSPRLLPGLAGDHNELHMKGRGVFVCISPRQFPLSVFVGQVAAALVAGNAVIAKPAMRTPLIAAFVMPLFIEAGIPEKAVNLLPGGAELGLKLVQHEDVAGVAFSGKAQTAHVLNRALAHKDGPIVPLVAETGGPNILIVDTSAKPEQVVDDVLATTFSSSGQTGSAISLICLPDTVADRTIDLLKGAMAELRVGDPSKIETDIGPVIDEGTKKRLLDHVVELEQDGTCLARLELDKACDDGFFIEPQAWEIPSVRWLKSEVFGPILHVVRYKSEEIDELIEAINELGYGITAGVHTRIDSVRRKLAEDLNVGNFYANKAPLGSSVGVRPFAGEAGGGATGRAGGPHYLMAFAVEQVVSANLSAAGGDSELLLLANQED
jgi:RHH-type proline utilization regulon transcriptional repressor/proline dehydrogenase/delta 1-pyrroline-5-carboxylate dehydrogenase